MDNVDSLMQLLSLALPGENPPMSREEIAARLLKVERELVETKQTLCEVIAWTQQQCLISDELNAILSRYDLFLRSIARAETGAADLVEQLDRLLTKGDDLGALRLYRERTNAVWDRCHALVEQWTHLSIDRKRQEVGKDLADKPKATSMT